MMDFSMTPWPPDADWPLPPANQTSSIPRNPVIGIDHALATGDSCADNLISSFYSIYVDFM